jgi:hypothetical protein
MTEKILRAAGDSFQTGQTAKALQGYRVQSLPRGTQAAGVVVNMKHSHDHVESKIQQRP